MWSMGIIYGLWVYIVVCCLSEGSHFSGVRTWRAFRSGLPTMQTKHACTTIYKTDHISITLDYTVTRSHDMLLNITKGRPRHYCPGPPSVLILWDKDLIGLSFDSSECKISASVMCSWGGFWRPYLSGTWPYLTCSSLLKNNLRSFTVLLKCNPTDTLGYLAGLNCLKQGAF